MGKARFRCKKKEHASIKRELWPFLRIRFIHLRISHEKFTQFEFEITEIQTKIRLTNAVNENGWKLFGIICFHWFNFSSELKRWRTANCRVRPFTSGCIFLFLCGFAFIFQKLKAHWWIKDLLCIWRLFLSIFLLPNWVKCYTIRDFTLLNVQSFF